jgi:hypothetical protein
MKEKEFFQWIKDRHEIYLKRQSGQPKPWTDDKIFLENSFCNPFRENDKTTKWFREHVRDPLKDCPDVYMATIIFRWFNYIPTGEILLENNLYQKWDPKLAKESLKNQKKIMTGAYMIKSPDGMKKLDGLIANINMVKENEEKDIEYIHESKSIKDSTEYLTKYKSIGNFISYEITTDLRHTYLLRNAHDIYTWANVGPGAKRGLNRLYGRDLKYNQRPEDFVAEMKYLLDIRYEYLPPKFPMMEMRDVEHSLCEFDKYQRIKNGDGRMKNKYNGYPEKKNSKLW